MTAREKFAVNDRVRLSAEGCTALGRMDMLGAVDVRGTVRGFGVAPDRVRVLMDGRRATASFQMDYWEPLH